MGERPDAWKIDSNGYAVAQFGADVALAKADAILDLPIFREVVESLEPFGKAATDSEDLSVSVMEFVVFNDFRRARAILEKLMEAQGG